jgi:hypothetical protein
MPIMTDKNLLKNPSITNCYIPSSGFYTPYFHYGSVMYKNGLVNGVMYKRTIIIMEMSYQHVIL